MDSSVLCKATLAKILEILGAAIPPAKEVEIVANCKSLLARIFSLAQMGRRAGLSELFHAATRGVVQQGPFVGMHLQDEVIWGDGDLAPKLLGTYEEELQPYVDRVIQQGYPLVVDVGAAEGYYAVGLARALPNSRVIAFDISEPARQILTRAARANQVSARLDVRERCTVEVLQELLVAESQRPFLLLDCEGGELELLDPQRVPALQHADFIVECHDMIDSTITATLWQRFRESHHLLQVSQGSRNPSAIPMLRTIGETDRWISVNENRTGVMHWLIAEAKGASAMAGFHRLLPPPPLPTPVSASVVSEPGGEGLIPICYTINGQFVRQLSVSLLSLLMNNDPEKFEIFVLCDAEAHQQRQVVYEVIKRYRHRVEFILIDDVYQHLPSEFTSAAYFRLSLPYVLNRDRIIYLDADTVIEADLVPLWETDLEGALCAGVEDLSTIVPEHSRNLGLTSPYINSGVLVLDLAGWRREKIAEQVLAYIHQNRQKILFPDQDGINHVLDGRKKLLHEKWNVYCHYGYWEQVLARSPQRILHFVSSCRAWSIVGQPPMRKIWEQYEYFTPWRGTPLERPSNIIDWFWAARLAKMFGEDERAYEIMQDLARGLLSNVLHLQALQKNKSH